MTIAFVHDNKAFLPALNFYPSFFSRYNVKCEVVTKDRLHKLDRDVDWFFMGVDASKRSGGVVKIHEYISPSVPPFRKLKDRYKKIFNVRPDLRIFKNSYVREHFKFKDNTPFCYQEIGIPEEWLNVETTEGEKKYDFIYIGDLGPQRNPEKMLNAFTTPSLQHHSLLILSRDYALLEDRYSQNRNIIFKGPVEKSEIPAFLNQARFALNYIPDKEPFNSLTSTKLLEYAAHKIPVITTDYKWMRAFEEQYGGHYFYVNNDLSNLVWDKLLEFEFAFPDLSSWTWEAQIKKSGVLEFLSAKFPHQQWQETSA